MSVPETTQKEQAGTVELDAQMWKRAVHLVSAMAHHKMPDKDMQTRISQATALAIARDQIRYAGEGVWSVPGKQGGYQVDAQSCECDDFQRQQAPQGLCKHRLSVMIYRKASKLQPADLHKTLEQMLADEEGEGTPPGAPAASGEELQAPRHSAPAPETSQGADDDEAEHVRKIPKQYIQYLHGKPHVRYGGLLAMAHEHGLLSLEATWTYNDDQLSLARAVATFADGQSFHECGDSTPESGKRVGVHWRRMSLTRAKARALRDALGLDVCSVEEME